MSQLIHKVLIANRGEIALRIIRTCRKMGIQTVAVFTPADANAEYVDTADLSVQLNDENHPTESYLRQDLILAAAARTGADAIHPGYGFLSENAEFAQACMDAGLTFIGPTPGMIAQMGSKAAARALMQQHDVPVVPGYHGDAQDFETLSAAAADIGYPVLLKASGGGGGKGMTVVEAPEALQAGIDKARREAERAFGDARLIIEKYFESVRHVEIQVLGDHFGNLLHLYERDCSIQRRYQKVIEESPAPGLDPELRNRMAETALRAAKAIDYVNAGTVEFILADSGDFFFLEMNTRLQVEHPVTERVTGLDLVQLQIEVAEGKPLSISQSDVQAKGHAIECRLYAEAIDNVSFTPATGKVLEWNPVEVDGLRYDSGIRSGTDVTHFYDPMLAKIIVWGQDRATALRKMAYALKHTEMIGLISNQEWLHGVVQSPLFQQGDYDTHFTKHFRFSPDHGPETQTAYAIAVAMFEWMSRERGRKLLKHLPSGWRNSYYQPQQVVVEIDDDPFELSYQVKDDAFDVTVGGQRYVAIVPEPDPHIFRLRIDGQHYPCRFRGGSAPGWVKFWGAASVRYRIRPRFPERETEVTAGDYAASMPGDVIKVLVEAGQVVEQSAPLLVMSSMKMENTVVAHSEGVVEAVYVTAGEFVEAGKVLLRIGEKEEQA